jgi:hypothetical protein
MKTIKNIFISFLAMAAFLLMQLPDQALAQSCNGNCGGSGGGICYCDDDCWGYGDCCADVCTYCGTYSPTMIANCGGTSSCLTCPSFDFTITATSTFQTHSSSVVIAGCKQYQVNLTAGNLAVFTFCSGGGTANYDTYLTLRNASCNTIVYNDDACSLLSEIIFLVPTTGTYYLEVNSCCTGGYSGNYTLAYRQYTPGPCDIITPIMGCGALYSETVTSNGTGQWAGPSACGYGTPGQEFIFEYTAPFTGVYSIEVVSATAGGYFFDYQWKTGSCSETGWTCIGDIMTPGTYGTLNWVAGTTYYILLDAEGTAQRTHEFYINCPAAANPCNSITTIPDCGPSYLQTYSSTGGGIWNSVFCGYDTWGQEKIYQFTPSVSGLYGINVTNTNSEYVDYFWKTGTCDESGWNCINDIASPGFAGMIAMTAGTTYYILLDAESDASPASHEFYISCPMDPLVCPPGAVLEGEPECYDGYVDSYNGGCNSTPYIFQTLPLCCGTICGKTGNYDGGSRDTDWYEFITTTSTTVDIKCVSEAPLNLFLIDGTGGCSSLTIISQDYQMPGDTAYISYTVNPGTYWIWVSTDFGSWPCESDYVLFYNLNCTLDAPGPITGPSTTCPWHTGVAYSVPAVANATAYVWTYTGIGATINGNSENITIDFAQNATSGVLNVTAINNCDSSLTSADFAIIVDPCAGIIEMNDGITVELVPNPSDGHFHCIIHSTKADDVSLIITDVQGKKIHSEFVKLNQGKNTVELNMNHLANGNYLIHCSGNHVHFKKLFMINR